MTFTNPARFFWPLFFFCMLLPLFGSAVFPLLFGGIVPATGVVFFFAYRLVFKEWALIRTPIKGLLPVVGSLLGLMLASHFWSYNPEGSLERALKLAPLILGGLSVIAIVQQCPHDQWERFKLLFPIGFLFVGLVCAYEFYFDLPLYRFVNGTEWVKPDLLNKNVAVFVMGLPVSLYLAWKSRSILLFLSFIALSVAVATMTSSQAAQLSLIIMIVASFGCLSFLEKLTVRTTFLCLGFLCMMMPWISPTLFDLLAAKIASDQGLLGAASTALRLENWDFLSRRIMESPFTGFGLDTTRDMTFDTEKLYFQSDRIMHPHNIALQFWIEFGVMGCAWVLLALGYFYALFVRLPNAGRRLGFICFATIMVFLLVSWSVWASWLVGLILYVTAISVLATKTNSDPSNS